MRYSRLREESSQPRDRVRRDERQAQQGGQIQLSV